MIVRKFAGICLFACAMFISSMAVAQEAPVQFAVVPFTVNGPAEYQYLGQGIQDMLISRLHWQDRVQPMDSNVVNASTSADIQSEEDAKALLGRLGCDMLVWGSMTILGEECSIDIKLITPSTSTDSRSFQASLNSLIPALERVAASINSEYFNRESAALAEDSGESVNTMNPGLLFNEQDAGTDYYLNPQFRYSGDAQSEGRMRTRSLPFASVGMVAADIDSDGRTEVLVLGDHSVSAYRFDAENQLVDVGSYEFAVRMQCLNIYLIDLDRNGYMEIVVPAVDPDNKPRTTILSLVADNFEEVATDINLFMAVVNRPPDYLPTLIGTRHDEFSLFDKDVYEVVSMGGEYTLGNALSLPPDANPFNFTYVPQGDTFKIVVIDRQDNLRVYSYTGELQYESEEVYSGSSVGLEESTNFGPFRDEFLIPKMYYIAKRMLPVDLDGDGNTELLLNHPVSLASQFFERYRYFPQGEVHCLYWDGVGMSLVWKTRRIRGSVVDYGIGDINNDGMRDLYVCVNTHPGSMGIESRRTVILIYPLDTSNMDQTIDNEFTEEQEREY